MLRLHEWVEPQWNSHLYSDKPPLPYWLAQLMWNRFGLIPELARIPAALCASLGVANVTCVTAPSDTRTFLCASELGAIGLGRQPPGTEPRLDRLRPHRRPRHLLGCSDKPGPYGLRSGILPTQ